MDVQRFQSRRSYYKTVCLVCLIVGFLMVAGGNSAGLFVMFLGGVAGARWNANAAKARAAQARLEQARADTLIAELRALREATVLQNGERPSR